MPDIQVAAPTLEPGRRGSQGVCCVTLFGDSLSPITAYAALRASHRGPSFLLESASPGERWGRYSIIGYRPRRDIVLVAQAGEDPFLELAHLLRVRAGPEQGLAARLARAYVGYLTYDLASFSGRVSPWPNQGPLARLLGECTMVVFDSLSQTVTIAGLDADDVEQARTDLRRTVELPYLAFPTHAEQPAGVQINVDDAVYEASVRRAQEYIRAGDAFQVVLARKMITDAKGTDPFDVYRALRVVSPSPYMYYLDLPETKGAPSLQIAGASPETLVRVEDGVVTVRPIAGTRRRGETPAEDEELATELLQDPKEMAEHVMLMDLARNDVGRVSRIGTVQLPSRMQIERFSHVMHITSEVTGRLRPDLGPADVMRSVFPAGTLSGAPKLRAMQIIREFEMEPRGVYGGAIGYFNTTPDLGMDLAIAIRTVVCQDGRFEVSAGAGVVEASVPQLESKETRNKARAALAAVRVARGF